MAGRGPFTDKQHKVDDVNDRIAVPDPEKTGEAEADLVLRALAQLGDELGGAELGAETDQLSQSQEWPPITMPREEDEVLLARFRAGLARLAESLRRRPGEGDHAVRAVLDGAQLTIRTDILTGHRKDLPELLPSFAYLVVLSVADEAQAQRVAERAAQLMEEGVRCVAIKRR